MVHNKWYDDSGGSDVCENHTTRHKKALALMNCKQHKERGAQSDVRRYQKEDSQRLKDPMSPVVAKRTGLCGGKEKRWTGVGHDSSSLCSLLAAVSISEAPVSGPIGLGTALASHIISLTPPWYIRMTRSVHSYYLILHCNSRIPVFFALQNSHFLRIFGPHPSPNR